MAESSLPADIFNSRYFGARSTPVPGGDLEFPLFSRLPHELRLQIWTLNLPRRRFLRVLLEEGVGAQYGDEPEHGHEIGDDGEWASIFRTGPSDADAETFLSARPRAPPLRVTFLGDPSPAMPALRLVCREARDAHNSVYRIRLPALARIPYGYDFKTTRIMAYLNPDLDMLSLQAPNPPEIVILNLLPLFLHHLLQHDFPPDPLRFGARHLCVDLRHLGSDHRDGTDDEGGLATPLAPHVLASVRLTLTHLRGLYLRLTPSSHFEPRVMSGPLTNTRSFPWYNASLPILPCPSWGLSGTVEPVPGSDPRLASPEGKVDLRQLWIGNQLRPSLDVWAGLERAWGVEDVPRTRVRALVGVDAEDWRGGRMGCGGGSLRAYLREESAAWRSLMDPELEMGVILRGICQTVQRTYLSGAGLDSLAVLAPEELISHRQPHTAVGFWLVEPEVLEAAQITGHIGKKIINLSERGPEGIELWVFRKPS